jgi:uncharacterized protein YggE
MDTCTCLKDKKINIALFILIVVISLFVVAKIVNEVRESKYIGRSETLNTITVSGEGEVKAVSDIAEVSMSLSKEAKTSKEAQASLNEMITKTLSYLKEKAIEDKDIKSEYGGLSPKYSYEQAYCVSYPCPRDTKIVAYTATQNITVKIRDVDQANDIKTGLASIGITNISGPTFSIDNEDILKQEAKSIAIKDAKEKAKKLAKELGVSLGDIVSYSDNSSNGFLYRAKSEMLSSDMNYSSAMPVVLPKGENSITSNVNITYEIK